MNGLILAGGYSTRMGDAKALLSYDGRLQFLRVADLLQPHCDQVFISCRSAQQPGFVQAGWSGGFVLDSETLGSIGPINGVLSALLHHSDAWLVIGCDYPFLIPSDILSLCQSRSSSALATAFLPISTQIIEPLIAIYEAAAATPLVEWVVGGNQSLRRFLEQSPIVTVTPQQDSRLQSVDTLEAYLNNLNFN